MQVSQVNNQSVWKQVYQDALFEIDQTRLRPKLEAALKAVQDRMFEVRSDPTDRRELMELEDAKRTIVFLRKHELQTWETSGQRWGVGRGIKHRSRPTLTCSRSRWARWFFVLKGVPMTDLAFKFWTDDTGQDIAEYAVMLAVILVLVVGTIRLVGSNANNAFSSVASTIQ
jgi:Flp pilus assembly pilin Flp